MKNVATLGVARIITAVTLFAVDCCKAKGVKDMKKDIHPEYHKCTVTCVSCGATFETGSTMKEIKVDTCSNCHPFYTGKQRFVQSDGRIDKFNKKLEKAQAVKAEAKPAETK
jgi:large subunit ribosomal protein L31